MEEAAIRSSTTQNYDGILPQHAIAELSRLTGGENTIVTVGVGQHQMWAAQYYKFMHPRTWLSSSGLGTMGFGLPAAMGAKAAYPDKLVVDIDGDGSFLMNIQELATCYCEKLPVKVLLLNNQHLGMVVQWEDRFFKGNRAHTYLGPIDNPEAIGQATAAAPAERYPDFVDDRQGLRLRRALREEEERAGRRASGDDRLRRPVRARRRNALSGARAADDPVGHDGAGSDQGLSLTPLPLGEGRVRVHRVASAGRDLMVARRVSEGHSLCGAQPPTLFSHTAAD